MRPHVRLLLVGLPSSQADAWRAALPDAEITLCAADGILAVSHIVEDKPDALIVSADIGQVDGFALCALVKNHAEFRAKPVILSLAQDSAFEGTRARLAGADQVVVDGEPTGEAVAALRAAGLARKA